MSVSKIAISFILGVISTRSLGQVALRKYMDSLNMQFVTGKLNAEIRKLQSNPHYHFSPQDSSYVSCEYLEGDSVFGKKVTIERRIFKHNIIYDKTIINSFSPIVVKITYDEVGNVRWISQMHNEQFLKENPKMIEYSIGKGYAYDEKGDISEILDYEDLHKFTIEDVFKFMMRNDVRAVESIIEVGNAPALKWEIWYRSNSFDRCHVVIDCRTGNINSFQKNFPRGYE